MKLADIISTISVLKEESELIRNALRERNCALAGSYVSDVKKRFFEDAVKLQWYQKFLVNNFVDYYSGKIKEIKRDEERKNLARFAELYEIHKRSSRKNYRLDYQTL